MALCALRQVCQGTFYVFLPAGDDHQFCACLRRQLCNGQADARTAAEDDDALLFKFHGSLRMIAVGRSLILRMYCIQRKFVVSIVTGIHHGSGW